MFENLSRGWRVGSATRRLVFQQKGLLLYPLVSGAIGLGEILSLFGAAYLFSGLSAFASLTALILYYPVVVFSSTYMLMAMLIAFRGFAGGERVGMRRALAEVRPYSKLIVEWAVFASIIMLALRLIQAPLGRLGGAIFGLVASVSISFATLFAIPVILDNKTGPIQTVKQSAAFLAKNFGKSFGGIAYAELYSMLLIVPGILLMPFGFAGGLALHSLALALLLTITGVILILFGGLLNYTMQNVLRLVIYEHWNGKPSPPGFPPELIAESIKLKKSSGTSGAAGASVIGARFCTSCGGPVRAGGTFCERCGARVAGADQ